MGHTDPLTNGALPIAAYGMLGDGLTAALVGTDGSVDWWCRPRFDSPAVFCRLLDHDRGGHCRVGPTGRYESTRRYLGSTGVLETTFHASEGTMRVTDLLVAPAWGDRASRLLRLVEGLAGEVDIEVAFRPTFDYARVPTSITPVEGGAVATGGADTLALVVDDVTLEASAAGARATRIVRGGDRFWIALTDRVDPRWLDTAEHDLERVLYEQQSWAAAVTYDGDYRDAVVRSAVTLSLLTHAQTGAPVAAPTTSLPEEIGGVRNWDYRYSWLRDAALGLNALQQVGHHQEAMAFWRWIAARAEDGGARLQIAYRVDGGTDLAEDELDHLAGHADSRPVRVGNAAAQQVQHDVAGEVLDAALYCYTHMPGVDHDFAAMADLADTVSDAWPTPDRGIWEVRAHPRHFLHSKLYAWVALDRAVRLAHAGGIQGDTAGWCRERDQVAAAILRHGVDPATGAFTRSFGSTAPDATTLAIPLVGFLPAEDPRVTATVQAVREQLEDNGLLYRYVTHDGLPGREGAFLPCTFWLAEVLALRGEHNAAYEVFERALGCANDLGLLAEQADPSTSAPLGNFPQAFTHLALVKAAVRLHRPR